MIILGKQKIDDFKKNNASARKPLDMWVKIVEESSWTTIADLRQKSPTTDWVNPHFVFNIGGNNYRLLSIISFKRQQVTVIKIGTHAEYEKWSL